MPAVIEGPTVTRVHITWMLRRNFPEVLAIEASAPGQPWTEDDFLRELRKSNCIGMVAEHGDKVVSFMVYHLNKHHIHLLNLAVDPAYRRQSIGRQMIDKLIGKLSTQRRTKLVCLVWEGNLPAHLFLRGCGLTVTAVERGVYEDGESDYMFEWRVGGEAGGI